MQKKTFSYLNHQRSDPRACAAFGLMLVNSTSWKARCCSLSLNALAVCAAAPLKTYILNKALDV